MTLILGLKQTVYPLTHYLLLLGQFHRRRTVLDGQTTQNRFWLGLFKRVVQLFYPLCVNGLNVLDVVCLTVYNMYIQCVSVHDTLHPNWEEVCNHCSATCPAVVLCVLLLGSMFMLCLAIHHRVGVQYATGHGHTNTLISQGLFDCITHGHHACQDALCAVLVVS